MVCLCINVDTYVYMYIFLYIQYISSPKIQKNRNITFHKFQNKEKTKGKIEGTHIETKFEL